jgi:hypothetical protein
MVVVRKRGSKRWNYCSDGPPNLPPWLNGVGSMLYVA